MKFFLHVCLFYASCLLSCTAQGENDAFIRQIHNIDIPGFPGAYNSSLLSYEDGYLLAFRHDTFKWPIHANPIDFCQHIGIIKLDKNFSPISPATILSELGYRSYDPRLVQVGNAIYVVYAAAPPGLNSSLLGSQMCLAQLHPSEDEFIVGLPTRLNTYPQNCFEKNWVPFVYEDNLFLGYTINPFKILSPNLVTGGCQCLYTTAPSISWKYGSIHGGTPAVLVDNEYLGFFESSCNYYGYTYFIGAYTFEAEPPFRLTRISTEPFSHSDFFSTPRNGLTDRRVVFPAGLVVEDDVLYISYGENDAGTKILEIDKRLLYDSMQEVIHDD